MILVGVMKAWPVGALGVANCEARAEVYEVDDMRPWHLFCTL